MSIKQQILIIDDDQDYCNLMCEILSTDYDCHSVHTGTEGLEAFRSSCEPIVVLVDLNLPDISGFEVCAELSKAQNQRDFAIFVISGDDQTETKIRAFEFGAEDYISKPFQLKELISRINRSISYVQGKQALKSESNDTKALANIAMAQASQYSYVMNFFKSLNHCQNITEIASVFFEAMALFQLKATLMIKFKEVVYYDSSLSDISPIEKNIYELLKDKGRLYEFGARIVVNGNNVSFLVKNLPSDPNQAGQARDFLAALIEGVEAKLADLELKDGLVFAISELSETISTINAGVAEHNELLSSVMTDMLTDISASYHTLDLTDDQEVYFTGLVETGTERMRGATEVLKGIQQGLEGLKEKMESIQIASSTDKHAPEACGDDVELF